ncbi:MAG: hypothetical protein ABJC09_05390 [Terriglobia bacterium]
MADIIKPPHRPEDEGNPQVSHERRDVNVFQITAFGIGLLISCIVVVFAMWAMFDFLYHREDMKNAQIPPSMMRNRPTLPPEPRLQGIPEPIQPHVELEQLHADEDAILNNYGWLDPAKGTVRIPIDQAIDMVAQKGLPSKPSPAGLDNGGYRMIPSDASSGRTLEKISQ